MVITYILRSHRVSDCTCWQGEAESQEGVRDGPEVVNDNDRWQRVLAHTWLRGDTGLWQELQLRPHKRLSLRGGGWGDWGWDWHWHTCSALHWDLQADQDSQREWQTTTWYLKIRAFYNQKCFPKMFWHSHYYGEVKTDSVAVQCLAQIAACDLYSHFGFQLIGCPPAHSRGERDRRWQDQEEWQTSHLGRVWLIISATMLTIADLQLLDIQNVHI